MHARYRERHDPLRIGVTGACGYMGSTLVREVLAWEAMAGEARGDTKGGDEGERRGGVCLSAVLEREGHPLEGRDIGAWVGVGECGVCVGDDIASFVDRVDAVMDFSSPDHSVVLCEHIMRRGGIHIMGTTGFTEKDDRSINALMSRHKKQGGVIVRAANMSVGVNLLGMLTQQASSILGTDFDIEIFDIHHRRKVDAPSGSAWFLAQAAAKGRKKETLKKKQDVLAFRWGRGPSRDEGKIGFASLRGGDMTGTHTVYMLGDGETLELTHRAQDRTIYAKGAMRAVLWARTQDAGLYTMADVLRDMWLSQGEGHEGKG